MRYCKKCNITYAFDYHKCEDEIGKLAVVVVPVDQIDFMEIRPLYLKVISFYNKKDIKETLEKIKEYYSE